ncbi:hypothetical protein [Kribbella shirazensis]|uniref:Uncharacterized protein n=1 Tax=Kribbella shirazensis TaxID=1105143 RepID=A0A7X5V7S0_9ACTN|nr:hypothetical protein [Kribbella shirazensis]NIK55934.1 hypothetical protein [Kribbella shirazensis]
MNKKLTARVLTGAAIVSAAGLFLGLAPSEAAVPARAAVVSTQAKPALKASSLHFGYKCWGRGRHCGVAVHAPKGWKFTQLSLQHAKFTDSSNTWMLRVNGGLGGKVGTSRGADQRVHALHGVAGFQLVSRTNGSTASKVGWDAPRVAYTEITYTYRDGSRGKRLVTTRFVDTFESGRRAYIELTVAGRPQDKAGLAKVMAVATERVALVG